MNYETAETLLQANPEEMDPETFSECVAANAPAAIKLAFIHLSKTQRQSCLKKAGASMIRLKGEELFPEEINELVTRYPRLSLIHIPHRLTATQLVNSLEETGGIRQHKEPHHRIGIISAILSQTSLETSHEALWNEAIELASLSL